MLENNATWFLWSKIKCLCEKRHFQQSQRNRNIFNRLWLRSQVEHQTIKHNWKLTDFLLLAYCHWILVPIKESFGRGNPFLECGLRSDPEKKKKKEVTLKIQFMEKLPNFLWGQHLMVFHLDWIHSSIWLFSWTFWCQILFCPYSVLCTLSPHPRSRPTPPLSPNNFFLSCALCSYFLATQPDFLSLL